MIDLKHWSFLNGLDIGADGDPYLDRLRIIETPLFGLYLHHIHREDIERDPHDHPWWFASLVITGNYEETILPDKRDPNWVRYRKRGRWSLATVPLRSAHIITEITGPLWTIVITGPKCHKWGFWRGGLFIESDKYTYALAGTRRTAKDSRP